MREEQEYIDNFGIAINQYRKDKGLDLISKDDIRKSFFIIKEFNKKVTNQKDIGKFAISGKQFSELIRKE